VAEEKIGFWQGVRDVLVLAASVAVVVFAIKETPTPGDPAIGYRLNNNFRALEELERERRSR